MHMQMYMLEGVSRWNMGRAKEAVDVEGTSALRSFDVHLMSLLNNLSQRVLGYALVPEFTPPGKPTGKRDLRARLINIPSTPSFSEAPPNGCEDCVIHLRDGCVYVCPFVQASA